ncbi:hypothetical protein E4191_07570 [Paracoccus liaowanqingii]|uniref:Chitin-binding type-3 domain-containing protein n=1 Tax=Paracoccus liaowanqingii TaxID=2560053 RepID=A0A4P7HKA3_9RHOB|nr:hypothetical protein [Paracoccus liaowanqingii]QBX34584.1 hypothetical protein E4191_07570 [Paracoccus liaowanqingii]
MKIIEPYTVLPAMMLASNVPETDFPQWVSGTTYTNGARVIRSNAIWESVQASNVGHDPDTDALSEWWFRIGATNRWRAFDNRLGGVTRQPGNITYTIRPPRTLNSIAFFGLDAQSVRVRVTTPGSVLISDQAFELASRDQVGTFWEYIYTPFTVRSDLILTGLSLPSGSSVEITVASTGSAEVGEIMIGNQIDIGISLMGSTLGVVDYSRKDRDEFGGVFIVPRPVSETVRFRFSVPSGGESRVQQIIRRITSKVCVFYALDGEDDFGMTIAGILRDYELTVGAGKSFGTIDAESLV